MRTVNVTFTLSDEATDALEGTFMEREHYDTLVGGDEDADVFKPDGTPLIRYRAGVLPDAVTRPAWEVLRKIREFPSNRATAHRGYSRKPITSGGYKSHTVQIRQRKDEMGPGRPSSAIIGAFDRNPRFPFCRLTAFNIGEKGRVGWPRVLPFLQAVDRVFEREMPDRYAAQMEYVRATDPAWVVHGTAFTTVTVNRNWRTALHKDAGDLKAGFGVMAVLHAGQYAGGFLVFPKYRVAVDMRTGGVCLADVHEWHGNTAITARGAWERVSCVLYYRERIRECGSPEEEYARVKARKPGETLRG